MNKVLLNTTKILLFAGIFGLNIACQNNKGGEASADKKLGAETNVSLKNNKASAENQVQDNKQPASDIPTPAKGEEPAFKFETIEHNFGQIKEGQIVKHTFKFKNIGKSPLVIKDATATCGCTVPKKPQNPIAPGGDGEIEVEFNSSGKSGVQEKDITVTANTIPAETKLKIKGTVDNISQMQGPLQKK